MPNLRPVARVRRGPVSYFRDLLVFRPLVWGLERQGTCGRRRLPTSAGGRDCQAPSAPPLFGSWRTVNGVARPRSGWGLGSSRQEVHVRCRHPALSGIQSHPSIHPRDVTDCSACLVASSPPPPLLSFPDFRQWVGSWGARATPPNLASLLLQEICALSVPTSLVPRSPRRGAGVCGRTLPRTL